MFYFATMAFGMDCWQWIYSLLPYTLHDAFASFGFACETRDLSLAEMKDYDGLGALMEGKQDDLMINNNLCRRLHIGSLIQHIFMFAHFPSPSCS